MRVITSSLQKVSSLLSDVSDGGIITDVVYQRPYCWENDRKEDFILELLKHNGVSQAIYLSKNPSIVNNKYNIHDGKQRLTTIKKFFNNEIEVDMGNGKQTYKTLSIEQQGIFKSSKIPVIEVSYDSLDEEHDGFIKINIPKKLEKFQRFMGAGKASEFHKTLGLSVGFKCFTEKLNLDVEKIEKGVVFSVMELALSKTPVFNVNRDLVSNWESKNKRGPRPTDSIEPLTMHLNSIALMVEGIRDYNSLDRYFLDINKVLDSENFHFILKNDLSDKYKKQQSVAFFFFILKLGGFNKNLFEKNAVRISFMLKNKCFAQAGDDIVFGEANKQNPSKSKERHYLRLLEYVTLLQNEDYEIFDKKLQLHIKSLGALNE